MSQLVPPKAHGSGVGISVVKTMRPLRRIGSDTCISPLNPAGGGTPGEAESRSRYQPRLVTVFCVVTRTGYCLLPKATVASYVICCCVRSERALIGVVLAVFGSITP